MTKRYGSVNRLKWTLTFRVFEYRCEFDDLGCFFIGSTKTPFQKSLHSIIQGEVLLMMDRLLRNVDFGFFSPSLVIIVPILALDRPNSLHILTPTTILSKIL